MGKRSQQTNIGLSYNTRILRAKKTLALANKDKAKKNAQLARSLLYQLLGR
jgi:hypothetical protein